MAPFPALLATCKAQQNQLTKLAVSYHGCGKSDAIGGNGPDSLLNTNRQLVAELARLNIPHLWRKIEGDHSWGVWKACLREFLPIVASAWR